MEGVVSDFWCKRQVLVTGHTGFKGGWLCLWLHRMGAHVTGYALQPPTQPNLFDLARIRQVVDSRIGDVRDLEGVTSTLVDSKAQVVFHLAAQPLVLKGYSDPVGTFETNLMGTVNLLQAVRSAPDVRAFVNITTDKCYKNGDSGIPFRESERLGWLGALRHKQGVLGTGNGSVHAVFFRSRTLLGSRCWDRNSARRKRHRRRRLGREPAIARHRKVI